MALHMVPVDSITVENRKRCLDTAKIKTLAESIKEIGLLNPIVITEDNRLIAGWHRLEAFKRLGREQIQTIKLDYDDLSAELAEIDENLIRNELTVLERSEHFQRRKEIYEAMHPETTQGGDRKSENAKSKRNNSVLIFTEDTAQKTGKSRSTIEQEVKIAKDLTDEVKDAIRETELADSKVDLLRLSRLKSEEQQTAVELIQDEKVKDVRGAIDAINRDKKIVKLEAQSKTLTPLDKAWPVRVSVILADPPWRYEHCMSDTRSVEHHYPTMSLDEICMLPVAEACTPDAILFLWTPPPKEAEAHFVINSWGFTHRTSMVWKKPSIGPGYWARQLHETILIATRGNMPTPHPKDRPASVFEAPRRAHSEKPEVIYEIIEKMFRSVPKGEMFARKTRPGWHAWGNEIENGEMTDANI